MEKGKIKTTIQVDNKVRCELVLVKAQKDLSSNNDVIKELLKVYKGGKKK